MNEEKMKGFLEEIQSLSDPVKKRVLVIATLIIMVIVISIWVSYFNGIVMSAVPQVADQATTTAPAAPVVIAIAPTPQPAAQSGPSFWQMIANFFQGPSNYSIKPQSN